LGAAAAPAVGCFRVVGVNLTACNAAPNPANPGRPPDGAGGRGGGGGGGGGPPPLGTGGGAGGMGAGGTGGGMGGAAGGACTTRGGAGGARTGDCSFAAATSYTGFFDAGTGALLVWEVERDDSVQQKAECQCASESGATNQVCGGERCTRAASNVADALSVVKMSRSRNLTTTPKRTN
jgi:hypothetical protein